MQSSQQSRLRTDDTGAENTVNSHITPARNPNVRGPRDTTNSCPRTPDIESGEAHKDSSPISPLGPNEVNQMAQHRITGRSDKESVAKQSAATSSSSRAEVAEFDPAENLQPDSILTVTFPGGITVTTTKLLGTGAFGYVYVAEDKDTHETYALKISKSRLEAKGWERLADEVSIMEYFSKHPNVVKLISRAKVCGKAYLLMQRCHTKSLYDVITLRDLDVPEILWVGRALVETIAYIHRKGCLHRDLKPQNLLFDFEGNIMVTDFGLASRMKDKQPRDSVLGTAMYMLPEMAGAAYNHHTRKRGEAVSENAVPLQYTSEVDHWSLGMVLYVLMTRHNPFEKRIQQLLRNTSRDDKPARVLATFEVVKTATWEWPQRFRNADPQLMNLVENMLAVDTSKRLSMDQILQHPVWKRAPESCPISLMVTLGLVTRTGYVQSSSVQRAMSQEGLTPLMKSRKKRWTAEEFIAHSLEVVQRAEQESRAQIASEWNERTSQINLQERKFRTVAADAARTREESQVKMSAQISRPTAGQSEASSYFLPLLDNSAPRHSGSTVPVSNFSSDQRMGALDDNDDDGMMLPLPPPNSRGSQARDGSMVMIDTKDGGGERMESPADKRKARSNARSASLAQFAEETRAKTKIIREAGGDANTHKMSFVYEGRANSTRWNLRERVAIPETIVDDLLEDVKCLNNHRMIFHSTIPATFQGIYCSVCDKYFAKKVGSPVSLYRCGRCDFDICTKCLQDKRAPVKVLNCDGCKKVFTTHTKLNQHVKTCRGPSMAGSPRGRSSSQAGSPKIRAGSHSPKNTAPTGRRSVSASPNRSSVIRTALTDEIAAALARSPLEEVPDYHSPSSARRSATIPEDSVFYDVFSKLEAQQGRQSARKPTKRNAAEDEDEDVELARDSTLTKMKEDKERRRREFVGEDLNIDSGIEVKPLERRGDKRLRAEVDELLRDSTDIVSAGSPNIRRPTAPQKEQLPAPEATTIGGRVSSRRSESMSSTLSSFRVNRGTIGEISMIHDERGVLSGGGGAADGGPEGRVSASSPNNRKGGRRTEEDRSSPAASSPRGSTKKTAVAAPLAKMASPLPPPPALPPASKKQSNTSASPAASGTHQVAFELNNAAMPMEVRTQQASLPRKARGPGGDPLMVQGSNLDATLLPRTMMPNGGIAPLRMTSLPNNNRMRASSIPTSESDQGRPTTLMASTDVAPRAGGPHNPKFDSQPPSFHSQARASPGHQQYPPPRPMSNHGFSTVSISNPPHYSSAATSHAPSSYSAHPSPAPAFHDPFAASSSSSSTMYLSPNQQNALHRQQPTGGSSLVSSRAPRAFLNFSKNSEQRQHFAESFLTGPWVRYFTFDGQRYSGMESESAESPLILFYSMQPGRYGVAFAGEDGLGTMVIDIHTSLVLLVPSITDSQYPRHADNPHVSSFYDDDLHLISLHQASAQYGFFVDAILRFARTISETTTPSGGMPPVMYSAYMYGPTETRVPPQTKFTYIRRIFADPDGALTLFNLSHMRTQIVTSQDFDIRWQTDRANNVGLTHYVYSDGRMDPLVTDDYGILARLELVIGAGSRS